MTRYSGNINHTIQISSNPRHKSRPSKMETTTEGVRLDALIASPPPKARESVFPSRAGGSSGRMQKVGSRNQWWNLTSTKRTEQAPRSPSWGDQTKETQYKRSTPKEIRHLSDAFGARPRRPESDAVRPSHGSSTINKYQSSMTSGSRPGPRCIDKTSIKTAFTSAHDIYMASRQIQYETLTLPERKKQEEWAQKTRGTRYVTRWVQMVTSTRWL
jgi:hypothetical protein